MYDINDKNSAVREIQTYLNTVSRAAGRDPCVVPDGIYDEKTRECVRSFQRQNGLDESGTVDYNTFELLYREYLLALEITDNCLFLSPDKLDGGIIKEGEKNELVLIIKLLLNTIRAEYTDLPEFEDSVVYDTGASNAVKYIQQIYSLPANGIIDKKTLNAIISDYNKFKNLDT
ncbi:MAG: hypothetical protein E7591_07630 [Ruminococcaceae bacterium]|nr:hypothetical protein [Oscillospiraceae bacterium]